MARRPTHGSTPEEITVARIVCQALQRGQRLTFLWSTGPASFEPYDLTGTAWHDFQRLAAQARQRLAQDLTVEPARTSAELAEVGHQLYRAIFRLDAAQRGSAAEIQQWFERLSQAGQLESLEILSDIPGRIPWNLLCGEPGAFWGRRYVLSSGRRVNSLRATPVLEDPALLLVIDPALREAHDNARLRPWRDAGIVIHSADGLASRLRQQAPDLLVLVCRAEEGELRLGPDRIRLHELRAWIDAASEGNPEPIVLLLGVGPPALAAAWEAQLVSALGSFDGLIASEMPLPQGEALRLGLDFVERFFTGKRPLGQALHEMRQEQTGAALALSAFCPATIRVADGAVPADVPIVELPPLPAAPYRPLAAYEVEDRPLFFGRADETRRCASLLDEAGTVGIFLNGAAGVGKTSLVQAGLMPYLEQEGIGYRLLRDRSPLETPAAESDYPILLLRATGDLAGQFADALGAFCSQPLSYTTPTGRAVTVDLPALLQRTVRGTSLPVNTAIREDGASGPSSSTPERDQSGAGVREVWQALCADPDSLGRLLQALSAELPFELAIAIDQGEELFTEAHDRQGTMLRQSAIDMLVRLADASARCKLLLSIRSEYMGRLVRLLPAERGQTAWREFHLEEMSEAHMAEALVGPTSDEPIPYTDEIPFRKYGFAFADGLPQTIVAEACKEGRRHQFSPLAWVQAVGALLAERRRAERRAPLVTAADLKTIGGTATAPARLLEERLSALGLYGKQQKGLLDLIAALCTPHAHGAPTLDLVDAKTELPDLWNGPGPVEPVVNKAAGAGGLLTIQRLFVNGQSTTYVSLAHEGIAAAAHLLGEARRRLAYGRTRVIDTLWIAIPLIFLAAALTFFFVRQNAGIPEIEVAKAMREVVKDVAKSFAERVEATQLPLYRGQLAQAEQALRAGNVLQARQMLLAMPARGALAVADIERPPFIGFRHDDLRGFGWRYLYQQVHSEKHAFEGHLGRIEAVAVSPDGKTLASASLDGTVKLWGFSSGLIRATLGTQGGPAVHAVAFVEAGKTVASAGADGVVRLWDIAALKNDYVALDKETKSLASHEGAVQALASDKEGKMLASAGADKTIVLWDTAKGEKKAELKGEHLGPIHALAFAPDGKSLASAGAGAPLVIWDVAGAKKRNALKTSYSLVEALAYAPDGKTLASGGSEAQLGTDLGLIRFWDPATGKEARTPLQHAMGVFGLAYHPSGQSLASVGKDTIVRLWDVSTGKDAGQWLGNLAWARAIAFSPEGGLLSAGGYDRVVRTWETSQSHGPQVIAAHNDWVLTLALGDNDALLASGSRDGTVKLWESATGRPLGDLPRQAGAVTALTFVASKQKQPMLAVATWGEKNKGAVKLYELKRGKEDYRATEFKSLAGHEQGITALAFDSDKLLASGDAGGMVIFWDTESGKLVQKFQAHEGAARALTFAEKGELLLTGGNDGSIRIWDTTTGRLARKILPAHTAPVNAIAAIDVPDAKTQVRTHFITGGQDQSVKLWVLAPKSEKGIPALISASMQSHNQPVSAVLAHPGLLASASWDHTIKLWDREGNERLTLLGSNGAVRALAAARDLSVLISADNEGKLRLWRAAAPREPWRPPAAPAAD
jgi:WD40 repeat protein